MEGITIIITTSHLVLVCASILSGKDVGCLDTTQVIGQHQDDPSIFLVGIRR
jgi:hypothetical protein